MLLTLLLCCLPYSSGSPLLKRDPPRVPAQAAFFLDDNPSGSSIVSLRIGPDGTLSGPDRVSTRGQGSIGVSAQGVQNTADPLFGQGSVLVAENLLFTVNAGSNTLAVFNIDPHDPWHPRLIGEPVDTLGDLPISVTYSVKLQTACVLNGGTRAGVSCFSLDFDRGLKASGPLRSLGTSFKGNTPPVGPPLTASQILFSPDSRAVLAIVKGSPGPPAVPGSISAFPVRFGQISTTAVVTQHSDLLLDFGSVFVDHETLFLSDPSFGAAFLDLSDSLTLTEQNHIVIPSQQAICWAAFDQALNTAYAIDAGQPVAYTFDTRSHQQTGQINGDAGLGGFFDAAVDAQGRFLYALTKAAGVVTLDLEQRKQVHFLNLTGFGNRAGFTGIAVWPASAGGSGGFDFEDQD